jgi:hypothetical protein
MNIKFETHLIYLNLVFSGSNSENSRFESNRVYRKSNPESKNNMKYRKSLFNSPGTIKISNLNI